MQRGHAPRPMPKLHHQHVQAQAKHTAAAATAAAAAVRTAPIHMQDNCVCARIYTHTRTCTDWAKGPPGLVGNGLNNY